MDEGGYMKVDLSEEEVQDRLQEAQWAAEHWRRKADQAMVQVRLLEGIVFGLKEGGYLPYTGEEVG